MAQIGLWWKEPYFVIKTNLDLELKYVAHDFRPSKVIFAMVLNFDLFFNIRIHIGKNEPLQKKKKKRVNLEA